MLNDDLVCSTCGRDFGGEDDLKVGDTCPAPDCPSTCDHCGAADDVSDYDNNGLWAEVEALCPVCLLKAQVNTTSKLDEVTIGLLSCLRDACAHLSLEVDCLKAGVEVFEGDGMTSELSSAPEDANTVARIGEIEAVIRASVGAIRAAERAARQVGMSEMETAHEGT